MIKKYERAPFYPHLEAQHLHGRGAGEVIYCLTFTFGAAVEADLRGVKIVRGYPPEDKELR